ncbi:D-alanine--D-alanine ligase [Slackia faecicanis]|uniref:D-alanine--D-alanine ligase n=1 Tax=Slackia faecicanis TaxID=255723 RepID=A0A3N0ADM4_9ACTN|nr:D-alanine--D-alanine ligase [Slackia faecicanis]RNL18685.1 D-alanine--D-alanine ligase [Slackia faecicanis]
MAYSGNPKDYAVAVLYGGTSGEREVSLNSGTCCARALEEKGFAVTMIDPASRDDLKRLVEETFDVAFLALHGKGGEDGTMQGFLETLGIPYTGSGILSNAIAINKGKSKELYESAGLRVAASVLVGRNDVLDDADRQEIVDTCGIPCVVKPSTEGSSLGMTIVRDASDLQAALDTALAVDDEAMVEQFIDGIELTVGVMGSDDPTAFPVIQILSNDDEFYNYHAKYAAGGSTHICPAPISEEATDQAQGMAVAAHAVLGCKGISRTDIMLDEEGRCWVLETNTLPGMTDTSLIPDAARAVGMDFGDVCEKLIEMALA